MTVQGERRYLWRAIDQDDDTIEILVHKRKVKQAAKRFFKKLLKTQGCAPDRMITDKFKRDATAKREVIPDVVHCEDRYANNRCEASHEHKREQERQMREFQSPGSAQRFLAVHTRAKDAFNLVAA